MKSFSVIAFVAAIALAGTGAYFSDTETSTGNTFTAGAIDLKIDNESYVTDNDGVLVASPNNSWTLDNLDGNKYLFFSFSDLKPGDIGEDTISIHVDNNDAWACMSIDITATPENGQSEPELADDSTYGVDEGELQDELHFAFWADDGDNVYEDGEVIFQDGLASTIFDNVWTLADARDNVWTGNADDPITGAITYYIGKAWCFGTLVEAPVAVGDGSPLVRGTGFTCNGADVIDNASQTDGIVVDVEFYTEQYRNNPNFTCQR